MKVNGTEQKLYYYGCQIHKQVVLKQITVDL
jgi:hypothetical protein